MMEESSENVFHFKDEKPTPDIINDYPSSLHDNGVPLVIDNGTYQCRAGWACADNPSLIFKNLTAKQKGKKNQNEVETLLGNDIMSMEPAKWILRSQFDRNIVTLFDIQEQMFDYLFSHLGITTEGCVDHPIVLTEAVCNPNYTRQLMSELLFECYHVPQLCYGVDSLFSFYYNHPNPETADALIVDCGYQATHILPVLDGRIYPTQCRRINIGGGYVDWFLQRLLQLKYPGHVNAITINRVEEMIKNHCYMATDFLSELAQWDDNNYFEKNVRKMQLPMALAAVSQMNAEQQKERRKQQISRLQEVNTKRRLEKLQSDETELQKLLEIQELILTEEDDDVVVGALSEVGLNRVEDLQEAVDRLSASIQRAKAKILGQEPAPIEQESKEPSFPLLDIPDEMLTPDQLAIKKRQKILKSAREGRKKALALQREKRLKEKEEEKKLEERKRVDFNGWLMEVRAKRQKILDSRNARRQKKSDMTKRRTYASQQRMRIISQLAAQPSKKGDNFGQNDADWDVYKEINREGGTSDSDAEEEKLEELETILKEHDPEFQKDLDMGGLSGEFDVAEYYRLHLGVERMRVPELLFQPSMLGLEQAGLTETMEFILGKLSADIQDRVVKYVFLTGGNANFINFKDRIDKELLQMRPFQSSYNIFSAANPSLDAWYGARKFALSPQFANSCITRKEYEEMGEGYFREHVASNKYFPTPIVTTL
ncbi:actin-related protein 5-like isoform X2 [Physella acuta]|uniref:actin-related protein 5-like isoform X2 n=1 Tax=Physella acuta TaxID=109671 RepID=UPI0027DB398D|nr:actin-related protein 5-like isoform X2 [Physella acuta]